MSDTVVGGPLIDFFSKTLKKLFDKTFSGWGDPIDQTLVEEDGFKGTKYTYKTETTEGKKCQLEITLFQAADSKSAYIVRCSHDGGKDSETSNAVRVAKKSGDAKDAIGKEVSEYVEQYCEKHDIVCEIDDELSDNPSKDIKVVTTKRNTLNIHEEFVNMDGVMLTFSHDGGQDEVSLDKEVKVDDELNYWLQYCHEHDLGVPRARGLDKENSPNYYKNSDYYKEVSGDGDEDVFLSRKLSVTLKRVTASNGQTDIHMCAVNASTCPHPMSMIKDVLADDAFVAEITAEPVSYEITEDPNGYCIEETDTVDTSTTYMDMIRAFVQCYYNLEAIRWGAKGEGRNELIRTIESCQWNIQYKIGQLAELCVEKTKVTPNVLAMEYTPVDVSSGVEFIPGIELAKQQLDELIEVIECYYVNFDHDIQSMLDVYLREARNQSNYAFDRTLAGCENEKCGC